MPRCPPGSRRCPPKTGKCHKSSKNTVKRNKTAKKSPAQAAAAASAQAAAAESPMPKLKWIDHLKMCSTKFNIKFGDAMKDPRCLKLYRESR
jgi:hypothetical protein